MALRIIRKSTSKSHVEIVKGLSPDAQADLSLLCYIPNDQAIEGFKQFVYGADQWISEHCELIIMKGREVTEPLRPHFPPVKHNAKLLNETEVLSISRRFRILVQEASIDSCVYLAFAPSTPDNAWLQALHAHLSKNPNHGMAGPILAHDNTIALAGMIYAPTIPAHEIQIAANQQVYPKQEQAFFDFLAGLPLSTLEDYSPEPYQTLAAPMFVTGIRRSAYLDLPWEDSDLGERWLAFDLGLALRQKQYWVHIVPVSIQISGAVFECIRQVEPLPTSLKEKWGSNFERDMLAQIYSQMGFTQEQTSHFIYQSPVSAETQIRTYLAEIKGS